MRNPRNRDKRQPELDTFLWNTLEIIPFHEESLLSGENHQILDRFGV